jgi:hypothetical protein
MPCFIISAVVLAAAVASLANHLSTPASGYPQTASATVAQPAPPASALSWSSDMAVAAPDRSIDIPAGFGWG